MKYFYIFFIAMLAIASRVDAQVIEINAIDYETKEVITPDRIEITNLDNNSTKVFENADEVDLSTLFTGVSEADNGITGGIRVFPNPVKSTASVVVNSGNSTEDRLVLMDIRGKIIFEKDVYLKTGVNKFDLALGEIGRASCRERVCVGV